MQLIRQTENSRVTLMISPNIIKRTMPFGLSLTDFSSCYPSREFLFARPAKMESEDRQARLLLGQTGSSVAPLMRIRIMCFEQVIPPVSGNVSPHGMDVIGFILHVIVLDEEAWPMQSIVVRLASLC